MKKIVTYLLLATASVSLLAACGKKEEAKEPNIQQNLSKTDNIATYAVADKSFSIQAPKGLTNAAADAANALTLLSDGGTTYIGATRFPAADLSISLQQVAWKSLHESVFASQVKEDELKKMTFNNTDGIGLQKTILDSQQSYQLFVFYYKDGEFYKGVVTKNAADDAKLATSYAIQTMKTWKDKKVTFHAPALTKSITLPAVNYQTSLPADWNVSQEDAENGQALYLSKDKSIAMLLITAEGNGSQEELTANVDQFVAELGDDVKATSTPLTLSGHSTYKIHYTTKDGITNTDYTVYFTQRDTTMVVLRFESAPSTHKNWESTFEKIAEQVH